MRGWQKSRFKGQIVVIQFDMNLDPYPDHYDLKSSVTQNVFLFALLIFEKKSWPIEMKN